MFDVEVDYVQYAVQNLPVLGEQQCFENELEELFVKRLQCDLAQVECIFAAHQPRTDTFLRLILI